MYKFHTVTTLFPSNCLTYYLWHFFLHISQQYFYKKPLVLVIIYPVKWHYFRNRSKLPRIFSKTFKLPSSRSFTQFLIDWKYLVNIKKKVIPFAFRSKKWGNAHGYNCYRDWRDWRDSRRHRQYVPYLFYFV